MWRWAQYLGMTYTLMSLCARVQQCMASSPSHADTSRRRILCSGRGWPLCCAWSIRSCRVPFCMSKIRLVHCLASIHCIHCHAPEAQVSWASVVVTVSNRNANLISLLSYQPAPCLLTGNGLVDKVRFLDLATVHFNLYLRIHTFWSGFDG